MSEVKLINQTINKEINLIVRLSSEFLYQDDLMDFLTKSLDKYKFNKDNLIVKISEHSAVDNFPRFESIIREINDAGIRTILTDFSMEKLSLYKLIQLPFSYIEMDHELIDEIDSNENTNILIVAILNLIRDMKKQSVCGNIVSKTQFNLVKKYKCDLMQGSFLKKLLNMDEIESYLKKHAKEV